MLPRLGPSPSKILMTAYRLGSLGVMSPLMTRRLTRGILGPARSSRGGRDGRHIMTERRSPGIDCAAAGEPRRQSGSQKGEPFSAVLKASPGTLRQCSAR
jgi:hypothetical protein